MSNRRRLKRQHPAAHLDGLHLSGSCCDTVLRVAGPRYGIPSADVMHDWDCAYFGDDTGASIAARMKANDAVARALGPSARSVVVYMM